MAVLVVRYRTETRRVGTRLVPAVVCPLCGTAGKLQMSVYQEYLIMFGSLPVTPMGRFGAAYCHHCRKPIPGKSDRKALRSAFDAVTASLPRSRLLAYAGTIIFALIAVAGYGGLAVAMLQQKAQREAHAQMQAWIADPKPGDIELVEVTPGGASAYTLLKVVAVSGDKVTLQAHRETKPYQYFPSQSRAFALFSLEDTDFAGATFIVPKSEFVRQFPMKTPFGQVELKEARRPSQS